MDFAPSRVTDRPMATDAIAICEKEHTQATSIPKHTEEDECSSNENICSVNVEMVDIMENQVVNKDGNPQQDDSFSPEVVRPFP